MIKIKPVKYADINTSFGQPGDESNFVKKPFPYTLYLNGDKSLKCRNFYGSKYIAYAVIDAIEEILDTYGIEAIRENGLDNYGGCYSFRKSRTSNQMSDHAWGLAIDYLPQLGQLGKPSMMPYEIVEIFKKRGFIWGGDWPHPDPMHMTIVDRS